jgi:hypothetical protein
MAVTVNLRPDQHFIGSDNDSWEMEYNVEGTTDGITARLELLLQTPPFFDGLPRWEVRCDYQGGLLWYGTVTYKTPPNNNTNGSQGWDYESDIGGASEKIYQSIATRRYPSSAVDYGGAIGVKRSHDDIDIEGADIYVPTKSFSIKGQVDPTYFSADYEAAIFLVAANPVNSTAFLGYQAGELLFRGSTGSYKAGADYGERTWKFDASPNRQNLSVGSVSGITKNGWELVDVDYKTVKDDDKKILKKTVSGVYVHQVYFTGSFSALRIA